MQLTFFYAVGSAIGTAVGSAIGSAVGSTVGTAVGSTIGGDVVFRGHGYFYLFTSIPAKLAEISLGHEELSMVVLAVKLALMCNTVGWGDYATSMGTSKANSVV